MSQSTIKIGKKDKTREIPRNSHQNIRNSREFPPGILGVRLALHSILVQVILSSPVAAWRIDLKWFEERHNNIQ